MGINNPKVDLKLVGRVVNWLADKQMPDLYEDQTKYLIPKTRSSFLGNSDEPLG